MAFTAAQRDAKIKAAEKRLARLKANVGDIALVEKEIEWLRAAPVSAKVSKPRESKEAKAARLAAEAEAAELGVA